MVGANTITLWNTGPAPDVDALELVGGVDDGDPTTSPTPTEPGGHPTEDPWAEDPASAKPASAPEAENRTLIEDYSSEFNGTDVDGLYRNFVDEWGWRSEWRWSDDNVAVADGSLALKQTFEPTSDYNTNVKGWQTAQLDVDLQTRNTDTATTYAAHTGASGLRHTYYNAFGTRTQQTFAALPAGQYEFSAWAQTLGTTGEVALFHSSCSATDSMARVEIPRANGQWEQGFHLIGGRHWYTECEPYSRTLRCRTEIWASRVVLRDGQFVRETGWTFNNLTYLPLMTRSQWASNPLGHSGEWTSNDNRAWRTECDTAVTGRNACRSYTWTSCLGGPAWGPSRARSTATPMTNPARCACQKHHGRHPEAEQRRWAAGCCRGPTALSCVGRSIGRTARRC